MQSHSQVCFLEGFYYKQGSSPVYVTAEAVAIPLYF